MQIHQVKGGRANSYIIEEEDRLLVIDVSLLAVRRLIAFIGENLGRDHSDVALVVCTHGHSDHLGGVGRLATRCRALIGLPELTRRPFWAGMWGDTQRLLPDCHLPGFDDWRVVHTPGHTDDSCCYLHEPTGSIVTGDTLLASAKRNRLVLPAIYRNYEQLLESIHTLASLNPVTVCPGHGSVLTGPDLFDSIVGA